MGLITTTTSVRAPLERLLAKTVVTDHGLMWIGSVNKDGYGNFFVRKNGKRNIVVSTHRYWYEQNVGPVPKGFDVHHKCHRRNCLTHLSVLPKRINRMLQLRDRRYNVA